MIETLYAAIVLVAGAIITAATYLKMNRPSIGEVFGVSFGLIGIVAAVDYFYPLPIYLIFAVASVGILLNILSVYLLSGLFRRRADTGS